MSRPEAAWISAPARLRRTGLKGPRAAEVLNQLGLSVPARPNSWLPLRASDRDDSRNVVGRLGNTEFFVEEDGDAPGIAALEAREHPGSYPVLREDFGLVLGGPRVHEVLAQVCNVNLAAMPQPKTVVMTLMIGVGVLVLPQNTGDGPIYRIWCDPSFGSYLWTELEQIVQKIPGRA
jgi:sarcosine oxidase, subunit gamma